MKAAQARRLANNVLKGKIKRTIPPSDVDLVLQDIKVRAGMGEMWTYVEMDALKQDSVFMMEKLGYHLEYTASGRPKWKVSWERKAV
jgi:hypothetical protein